MKFDMVIGESLILALRMGYFCPVAKLILSFLTILSLSLLSLNRLIFQERVPP